MAKWLLDFDSVCADLGLAQVRSCNGRFGTAYTVEDIVHWGWWEEKGDYGKYVWGDEVFKCPQWTLRVPPMEGALEALNDLALFDQEFYVVSDRAPHMGEWLRLWFDKHGFVPDGIQVTSRDGYTKLDATRDLGLTIAIDDALHNVAEFRDSGLFDLVILLDRPWNRGVQDDGVVRLKNWNEVLEYFYFWWWQRLNAA